MKHLLSITALLSLAYPAFLLVPGQIAAVPVDDQIETYLEQFPGGTQTAWNEISWDDGAVVLTVPATRAVGTCASGTYCVYSNAGRQGTKVSFTACTGVKQSVPLLTVGSAANARSSGTARGYSGSTQLWSVAPGGSKNVSGSTTHVSCS